MSRPLLFIFILFLNSASFAEDTLQLKDTPPVEDGPVKIYIDLFINNINEISASSQLMKADIFISAVWKDPRLAHGGKGKVTKKLDEIWSPEIVITNRLNVTQSLSNAASVFGDGTVMVMQRIYGDFTQDFQMEDFPMDMQTFVIRVIAIGSSVGEIEFEPDLEGSLGISDNISLQEWNILDWKYDTSDYIYMDGESGLPSFTFIFSAERKSGFYILIYVVPLILIIMMSWAVFWLNPKLSSSQISVATTSMLTLIAYRFVVFGNLPKISYLTRMDIFVFSSSVLIFLTLVQSVFTASLVNKGNEALAGKVDIHSRWIFPLLYLAVYLTAFVF